MIGLKGEFFGPFRDFPLNLLIKPGEQFPDRFLEHRFTCERRAESGLAGKPLVSGSLGAAFRPQQIGDVVLGKTETLAMFSQIIRES